MSAVIDCHTHVWPDRIAERALSGSFPELERHGDGRVSSLLNAMEIAGITAAVCLGVADTADRVPASAEFAASLSNPLIGFGSIHAEGDAEQQLILLRRLGIRGVKMHPLVQGYALDHPKLRVLLDAMQGEFVVICHVGAGSPAADRLCAPHMVRRLVRDFPRLDFIACHFGGYRMFEETEEAIVGLPVYVDTAWPPSLAIIDAVRVRNWIGRHGYERVVFGSDWPMANPAEEIRAVEMLRLPSDQTDAILGGNLSRLLKEGK